MQKFSLFILSALISLSSCANKKTTSIINDPILPAGNAANTDTVTFGTGCFWCTEAIFQQVEGVLSVESGYSGGHVNNPTYEQIGTGATGHAECLNIVYDTTKVTYDELLEIFWQTHDPTTLNRQGNDIGPQYRSVIFYRNAQQKLIAEKYKTELDKSGAFPRPIVTTFEPMTRFFKAENYHQNYYNQNGNQPYCLITYWQ
ncbi:MAG TPA: peptide-methionine (S)-S-oxide reductase MsrA [Ferruginibacter sp.]|nr:peptide-methionine (S)-S-oxide reductase MsrA [Ferruginibacter sp.]